MEIPVARRAEANWLLIEDEIFSGPTKRTGDTENILSPDGAARGMMICLMHPGSPGTEVTA